MNIDWVAPFKLAFEVGMFALGSLLLLAIISVVVVLASGIVRSVYVTVARKNKVDTTGKNIRKIFPVQDKDKY